MVLHLGDKSKALIAIHISELSTPREVTRNDFENPVQIIVSK